MTLADRLNPISRAASLPPLRGSHYRTRRVLTSGIANLLDFEQAYDDHVGQIYGFFAYRLSSRDDAEDLTQLCFERALKAWDRFDSRRGAMGTWLLSIARNLLVDHYRAAPAGTSHVPLENVDPRSLPTSGGPVSGVGLEPEIARALDSLTDRDREIVALRYGADLTGPEIADVTGLSVANVQQIISRSLRRMRSVLEG